jgi:oxygen-independent coproporphyrinogen-3 oxidase
MLPPHLYIHVPFCARRCSYCDFAIAVRRVVPTDEFVRLVASEIDLRFGSSTQTLETLYLGGGTPSRLGPSGIQGLVDLVRARATIAQDAEVTIEANPDDVTKQAAKEWRAAGVNRVSLGVQSFDDRVLQWMHRVHDSGSIGRAFSDLRSAGFEDISIDLIFALPESLGRNWREDLERGLALKPEHVSLYGLTVEPQAPLGRWVSRGEVTEASEDSYAREFLEADRMLTGAGFEHYEVSNFAKPGHRARHNFCYWQGVAYAGVGPGAHEFDGSTRRWNVRAYEEWAKRLRAGIDPMEGWEGLTADNFTAEKVYLGLRTVDGLAVNSAEAAHVSSWIEAGWAQLPAPNHLVLTPEGWLRLDSLAADLTLFRSH